MKETPNIISSKDLLYIEDMMNWNLIMNKKISLFLDLICDDEVSKILNNAMKMHSKHFKELLKLLD